MYINHERKTAMMLEWENWVIIPKPFNYYLFACTSSILLFTLLSAHRSLFCLPLPFLSTHCPHFLCWRPFNTKTETDKERSRESAQVLIKGRIEEGENAENWKGKNSSELEQIMFTTHMKVGKRRSRWLLLPPLLELRAKPFSYTHTHCCFSSVSSLTRIVCTFQHSLS